MTSLTHDTTATAAPSRLGAGLGFALVSATTFGLSGALARGLLDSGWSAPAAVTARIVIAALVLVVPGALALRGRWHLLSRNGGLVAAYGVAAVAGAQLCYFYAVSYLQVGVALLIEYTAPVAVVVWLWLRHGHRPHRLTVVGAAIAAVGLVLVLDVVSGADLNLVGVAWGLGAMVGAATYFVISADEDNGLPGISLAAGGLVVGGTVLGVAGLLGVLPMRVSSERVSYQGFDVDVVGAGPGARAGHGRHRLRHRDRGGPAARVAAGVVRRPHRGADGARLRLAAARRAAPPDPAGRWPAGARGGRGGQAGGGVVLTRGRAGAGPRQRASCRLRKTSRCSRSRAAATGTASSAPMMPIRLPPRSAAMTVTEPGMSTERFMIRG